MPGRDRYSPDDLPTAVSSPEELVKEGNVVGDDGNWRRIIVGNDIKLQQKVSGIWKTHGFTYRGE